MLLTHVEEVHEVRLPLAEVGRKLGADERVLVLHALLVAIDRAPHPQPLHRDAVDDFARHRFPLPSIERPRARIARVTVAGRK